MKPIHLEQPTCPHQGSILEAVPVWEVMASATADGQLGHASPLAPAHSSWLLSPTHAAAKQGQPWRDDDFSELRDTALDQVDHLGKHSSVPACDFAERAT